MKTSPFKTKRLAQLDPDRIRYTPYPIASHAQLEIVRRSAQEIGNTRSIVQKQRELHVDWQISPCYPYATDLLAIPAIFDLLPSPFRPSGLRYTLPHFVCCLVKLLKGAPVSCYSPAIHPPRGFLAPTAAAPKIGQTGEGPK